MEQSSSWLDLFFFPNWILHTEQARPNLLLPDPDGKVAVITVSTNRGSQILDKPKYATEVEDVNKAPITPQPVNENEITDVFGLTLRLRRTRRADLSHSFYISSIIPLN